MNTKALKGKKTYLGILLLAIPALLKGFDVEVTTEEVQAFLEAISSAVGMVLATYGRFAANK